MPYKILLFVTRKSTLTPQEFKDYWENKHIPLLRSLTGTLFPMHHTRRYLARTKREGFGGPANRDHPLLALRGNIQGLDYDGVAELVFEDEKAFQEYYKAIYKTDTAAKLAEDEEQFMDSGAMTAIVVGETMKTRR